MSPIELLSTAKNIKTIPIHSHDNHNHSDVVHHHHHNNHDDYQVVHYHNNDHQVVQEVAALGRKCGSG